ncbi:MAG TPA: hypothetical protein VIF12_07570, partial [Micavibrio sp.]
DLDSHIHDSFVAIEPGGRMVGFILGDRGNAQFPNGTGIINLIVSQHQEDMQDCTHMLVRAAARHCMGAGQNSMDMLVINDDAIMTAICAEHQASKGFSVLGVDQDNWLFEAVIYTIDDLSGKFGLNAPEKRERLTFTL